MKDVSLIHKELAEMTGMKTRLGQAEAPPPKEGSIIEGKVIGYSTGIAGEEPMSRWTLNIRILTTKPYFEGAIDYLHDKIGKIVTTYWNPTDFPSPSYLVDKTIRGVVGQFYDGHIISGIEEIAEPVEDERLQDLLRRIAEHEARLAELKRLIAELEAKIGMTGEEKAILARLDTLMEEEAARIRDIEARIPPVEARISELKKDVENYEAQRREILPEIRRLQGAITNWNRRIETVRRLGIQMNKQTREYSLTANFRLWKADYDTFKTGWADIDALDRINYKTTCYNNMYALLIMLEGKWYSGYYCRAVDPGEIPNSQVIDTMINYANSRIYDLEWQLASVESALRNIETSLQTATRQLEEQKAQLRDLQDELERANRRLWDAKAAKERATLEIRRAIALRQAEVEAAKARYELELRTLDNLRATYEVLLKEIDLAKAEAIAEAARQREEVIKADEEDRLSIAEEQRRLAEEYERLAAESAGTTREEWLKKMRIALELAKDAEEAAIIAAQEREKIARDMAIKKLELAQIELELEELRKQQQIAEERKKKTEEEIAGLPIIPKWGWIALGIGGATATAGGIAYAIKKKKKK